MNIKLLNGWPCLLIHYSSLMYRLINKAQAVWVIYIKCRLIVTINRMSHVLTFPLDLCLAYSDIPFQIVKTLIFGLVLFKLYAQYSLHTRGLRITVARSPEASRFLELASRYSFTRSNNAVLLCWSLGFWRRVDLQVDAYVSEKHAVSIFRGLSDTAGKYRAYVGRDEQGLEGRVSIRGGNEGHCFSVVRFLNWCYCFLKALPTAHCSLSNPSRAGCSSRCIVSSVYVVTWWFSIRSKQFIVIMICF
jgi:hypothetical protein